MNWLASLSVKIGNLQSAQLKAVGSSQAYFSALSDSLAPEFLVFGALNGMAINDDF
jgi:hypothetical protein